MYEKLKTLMKKFNIMELKEILGNDISESLLEWLPETRTDFNKSEYVDMILCVKGIKILQDKSFRLRIINKLSEGDVLTFSSVMDIESQETMRAKILNSPFTNKNKVSVKLLEVLDVPVEYVWNKKLENENMIQVSSYDKFYELLDYQYLIKQRVLKELNSDIDLNRMLVHMPTGTGKTKTTMHTLINYFIFTMKKKGVIVWIAHTKELLEQAYATFCSVWKHLGMQDVNIYKLWGDADVEINDNTNGIVFCGIQKLSAVNNKPIHNALINRVRLIIFDEAHKAAASETRAIVESFMIKKEGMCNRHLVGLTATPGRTTLDSNENLLLVNMFNNKLISIDTKVLNQINMSQTEAQNAYVETDIIKYFQDRKILSKLFKEELEYEETFSNDELKKLHTIAANTSDKDYSYEALAIFGKNRSRNSAILKRLRELSANNIPTIVFACSVEHSKLLSAVLSIEGIKNSLVIGDMESQEREQAIADFKNNKVGIIINFGVLTTGFDSTNIKCVFIARPTKSVVLYSQMIGRGLRGPQMGGNEECLLIDVKDNLLSFNENRAFNHFGNYWNN